MKLETLLEDHEFKHFIEKSDPNEFTFYEVLQMAQFEIRHSNTLAWLFDPRARHHLGSLFLKTFIENVFNYRENREILSSSITIDETGVFLRKTNSYIDFDNPDFNIQREENYIDILISSRANRVVLIIENKPGTETPGQLSGYKNDIIDVDFPVAEYTRIFVFLTIDGTSPEKEEDKQYWLPFDYKEIVKIIDNIVLSRQSIEKIDNDRIVDFIRQYVYNLKKNMVNYYDLSNEASMLYNRHKEIFDYLIHEKDTIPLNEIIKTYDLQENVLNSLNYIILKQSDLHVRLLKKMTKVLKLNNVTVTHHVRDNQKWVTFYMPDLKDLSRSKRIEDTCIYTLGVDCITLDLYKSSPVSKTVLKNIQNSEMFQIYRHDSYSCTIYKKTVLTADDYYKYSFEQLIQKYKTKLEDFLIKDTSYIHAELLRLV